MVLAFGAELNGNPSHTCYGWDFEGFNGDGGLWCRMLMLLWLSVVCLDNNPFTFQPRTGDDPREETGKHGTPHPRERAEEAQVPVLLIFTRCVTCTYHAS